MTIALRPAAPDAPPAGTYEETVTEVTHYTDRLFHFRMTRPAGFRFRSGEFVMIGLPVDGKPLFRAYSIASPAWAEDLEFYSIKVPDGPLTSRLQSIRPGDGVSMRRKSTGTLVNDALRPGRRLFMFSTGTGIAPFASIIRDPETYQKFDSLILTHTCREAAELRFGEDLVAGIRADELLTEVLDPDRLKLVTSTTRDEHPLRGRITDLLTSGRLFERLGEPPLDPATDRAMICGSAAMLRDTKAILDAAGFGEGANNRPAEYVIERAFAE